ncbi:MAG: hypothetical protein Q8P20_05460 [bacterium]|nr:hypothetical protein [bacterium]
MNNPSPEHQMLVKAMLDHFTSQLNYSIVTVAYTGYDEPEKHGKHEPDIVAKDANGLIQLAEAKIGDDLSSETTQEQFEDFSKRIMSDSSSLAGREIPFHIIVFQKDEAQLRVILNNLKLGHLIDSRIHIWTL